MKLCYGIRNSEGGAIHKNGNKVKCEHYMLKTWDNSESAVLVYQMSNNL